MKWITARGWRHAVPLLVLLLSQQACLKVEQMELRVRPRPDGRVSGEVIYRGLYSSLDEDSLTLEEEFQQLVKEYLQGDALASDLPGWRMLKRELFEDQGELCGRLIFEGDNGEAVGLFQDKTCACAGWVLVPQDGDLNTLISGDGIRTPYGMRWSLDHPELTWVQRLDVIERDDRSLLPTWQKWPGRKAKATPAKR
ncbi:MAG: hypothetical protein KDC10_14690 [Calditrichaeota bacterium]|nr:hypothetical protein [Calditrichota bacterium]MCB9474548.1 hypothetical protein [Candidatus Delongbacteria bacterium]